MSQPERATLLLGGTGFIGSHIAGALAGAGHRVVCPVRPERFENGALGVLARPDIDVVPVDLTCSSAVTEMAAEKAPDAVIDASWSGVHVGERNDRVRQQQSLHRLALVVDAVLTALPGAVTTWVGLGSQAECGHFDGRIDETFRSVPASEYGRAKKAAHDMLRERLMPAGVRVVWLRVFGVYGPRQPRGWLIPDAITTLRRGAAMDLTSGEQRCDYLYAKDLARACVHAAHNTGVDGLFNVGSGSAVSVRHIVCALRELIRSRSELRFGAIGHRPGQPMFQEADVTRLRATGWAPSTSLARGLEATVRHFAEAA